MLLQLVKSLTGNIQSLTGCPVQVVVTGVTAGANASAATVITAVTFPATGTGTGSSLQAYLSVLSSSKAAAVYGTQFAGTIVDLASIQVSYVAAAGKHLLVFFLFPLKVCMQPVHTVYFMWI